LLESLYKHGLGGTEIASDLYETPDEGERRDMAEIHII
jgi:hypothetical protein